MTRTVGVVGARTMGRGASHAFAAAGLRVVLVDTDAAVLAPAREQTGTDAKLRRMVDSSSGAGTPAPEHVLGRIRTSTDLGELAGVRYVVENVTKKWAVKTELYRTCAPDCVLAVNTSAIPITRLAGLAERPELVVSNHFMNPAHLMPMVEVVRGLHTSDSTVDTAREPLTDIGKECVVVNDSPGFVTNRVAMLAVNEVAYLLARRASRALPTSITCSGAVLATG